MGAAADRPAPRVQGWLLGHWFRPAPSWVAIVLRPLAWLYRSLQRRDETARRTKAARRKQPACPVLVVGNLIVGGAGKTPTTIALVQALQAAGRRPGVVSRGHGRRSHSLLAVHDGSVASEVGDEPLLIHRRTGAPLVVGRDRVAAAVSLLQRHPEVDLIIADDGLQHRQLRRDVELIVFDARGIGNGELLPAGPLREPFTAAPPQAAVVLYTDGEPSTRWPGACARRRLSAAWRWADWQAGRHDRSQPLSALHGRSLLAMAGIAVPERFFGMLEAAGLSIQRLPLPDHHRYDTAPWPAHTRELVTTEKDAVKLAAWAGAELTIWVVGLDLTLPGALVADLLIRLPCPAGQRPAREFQGTP